jgi:hypothetical protein
MSKEKKVETQYFWYQGTKGRRYAYIIFKSTKVEKNFKNQIFVFLLLFF